MSDERSERSGGLGRRARGARQALARRAARALDLAAAIAELERLYRREVAQLLLRAARCARAAEAGGSCRAELRAWRRAARELLSLALHDGVEPPALLRSCARRELARWPSARALEDEARRAERD